MSELNLSSATTTNLTSAVPDFIVQAKALDYANKNDEETVVYYEKANLHINYYLQLSEIFNLVNAISTWTTHRGYTTEDDQTKIDLEHVRGAGNSSATKIFWNHQAMKLVCGDAFCEMKWNENRTRLLNMIPISPERVRTIYGKDGLIKRYEVWNSKEWRKISPENMLHSSNKQIGDMTKGTSQIEPSISMIHALNEAIEDERIIKHRDKALGIVYYETDKSGKIAYANEQIEKGVKNGEMIGLAKGTAEILPFPGKSSEDRSGWVSLIENRLYQNFGVPRSIASPDSTSEVGGKMGHVNFEPIYVKEQKDLEEDLWVQQQIKLTFNRPPSLGGLEPSSPAEDMAKNSGQSNFQPNDSVVNLNRE